MFLQYSNFWSQDPYDRYVVVVGLIQKIYLKIAKTIKLSKLKVVRIESCQKCKLPKLQVAKIASCQNCKLPKLKIAKIASCQSWNWFFNFLLKVSIFDELSWKLPNCKLPKLQVVKIASCQNWKLPKLQVAQLIKLICS